MGNADFAVIFYLMLLLGAATLMIQFITMVRVRQRVRSEKQFLKNEK